MLKRNDNIYLHIHIGNFLLSSLKSDVVGRLIKSISCRVSCSSFLLEESCWTAFLFYRVSIIESSFW